MKPAATGADLLLEDQTLRDGLQMESRIFSLDEKRQLFQLLQKAGIQRIQVGSFVHPQRVPQLAETDALIRSLGTPSDTVLSALVLNEKGLQRALDCGLEHVSMSASVSDTHSRKNVHLPAAEALDTLTAMIHRALGDGIDVQAGLQCVFGCVYEGRISEDSVLRAVEQLARTGVKAISLADTTGMATPHSIRRIVHRIQAEIPEPTISLHLHDTRGLGLANIFSGYEAGVRVFDLCTGGLGGCPFVQGAAGNVPTEDAVHMFEAMGIQTGVDLTAVCDAVEFLEKTLGRSLPGKMKRVIDQV